MASRWKPKPYRFVVGGGDADTARVHFDKTDPNGPTIRLSGVWHLHHGMPTARQIESELISPVAPRQIVVEGSALTAWDSSVVNFLTGLTEVCAKLPLTAAQLPQGLNRLIDLANAIMAELRNLAERFGKRDLLAVVKIHLA